MTEVIQRLVPVSQPPIHTAAPPAVLPGAGTDAPAVIYVVDDDQPIREMMRSLLEEDGRVVEDFESCEAFLAAYRPGREACC